MRDFYTIFSPELWLTQDITEGDGTGGESIYGYSFKDENSEVSRPGVKTWLKSNEHAFCMPMDHLETTHFVFNWHLIDMNSIYRLCLESGIWKTILQNLQKPMERCLKWAIYCPIRIFELHNPNHNITNSLEEASNFSIWPVWVQVKHDSEGILSMANSGPETWLWKKWRQKSMTRNDLCG